MSTTSQKDDVSALGAAAAGPEIVYVMGPGDKVKADKKMGAVAKGIDDSSVQEITFVDMWEYKATTPTQKEDVLDVGAAAGDIPGESVDFLKDFLDPDEMVYTEMGFSTDLKEKIEKVRVDPFDYFIVPGLYRTVLVPSEDNNEIDLLYSGVHFPKKGAFVEVTIKGLRGLEVIYPRTNLEFFIGDGHLEGLPYILDAALTHFRRGETSLLTISKLELLQPVGPEFPPEEPNDPTIFYSYHVTLEKFQNLPEVPEEYALDDRIMLCERLIIAAKKLYEWNELTRSVIKYDFVRKNLEDFAILLKEVPEELDTKRLVLLEKALIGLGTCLLDLETPEIAEISLQQQCQLNVNDLQLSLGRDPACYANRALVLKPESVEVLLLLADIYFKRKEPQQALDLYDKVHKLQPICSTNLGIRFQITECSRMLNLQKIVEEEMAARMLGLELEN